MFAAHSIMHFIFKSEQPEMFLHYVIIILEIWKSAVW